MCSGVIATNKNIFEHSQCKKRDQFEKNAFVRYDETKSRLKFLASTVNFNF